MIHFLYSKMRSMAMPYLSQIWDLWSALMHMHVLLTSHTSCLSIPENSNPTQGRSPTSQITCQIPLYVPWSARHWKKPLPTPGVSNRFLLPRYYAKQNNQPVHRYRLWYSPTFNHHIWRDFTEPAQPTGIRHKIDDLWPTNPSGHRFGEMAECPFSNGQMINIA